MALRLPAEQIFVGSIPTLRFGFDDGQGKEQSQNAGHLFSSGEKQESCSKTKTPAVCAGFDGKNAEAAEKNA
jgi:hypothetical protein